MDLRMCFLDANLGLLEVHLKLFGVNLRLSDVTLCVVYLPSNVVTGKLSLSFHTLEVMGV